MEERGEEREVERVGGWVGSMESAIRTYCMKKKNKRELKRGWGEGEKRVGERESRWWSSGKGKCKKWIMCEEGIKWKAGEDKRRDCI